MNRKLYLFSIVPISWLIYLVWSGILFITTFDPIPDDAREVSRQGASFGYRMEGFFGDFDSPSNNIGACEVKLEFPDYSQNPPRQITTVFARRAWALGGWEIVEVKNTSLSK